MYVATFSSPFASKAAWSAGILMRFLPPTLIPRRRATYLVIAVVYHEGVDVGLGGGPSSLRSGSTHFESDRVRKTRDHQSSATRSMTQVC